MPISNHNSLSGSETGFIFKKKEEEIEEELKIEEWEIEENKEIEE